MQWKLVKCPLCSSDDYDVWLTTSTKSPNWKEHDVIVDENDRRLSEMRWHRCPLCEGTGAIVKELWSAFFLLVNGQNTLRLDVIEKLVRDTGLPSTADILKRMRDE